MNKLKFDLIITFLLIFHLNYGNKIVQRTRPNSRPRSWTYTSCSHHGCAFFHLCYLWDIFFYGPKIYKLLRMPSSFKKLNIMCQSLPLMQINIYRVWNNGQRILLIFCTKFCTFIFSCLVRFTMSNPIY